jgi:cupin 2 domain-containing protein
MNCEGIEMTSTNVFSNIPHATAAEFFETLLEHPHVKLERIVSHGHSSPKDFWFDQDMDEWVILLKGRARLLFDGDPMQLELVPGDYLEIPAHRKHRLEWTDPNEDTVWLAVYHR